MLSASITRAGIWREVLEFVRLPLPLLRVGRGRFFDRNIWPDFRVFLVQRQPFLEPRLGVRLDRVDRAFRHADPAIDAFVRVDDEHVLALVEAVHGAHVDAVHDFAANTALVDDEGQLSVLSADRSGELISWCRSVLAVLVHWLKMDAQKTFVLWLNRNTEEQAFSGRGAAFPQPPNPRSRIRGWRRVDEPQRARHRIDRRWQGLSRPCTAGAHPGRGSQGSRAAGGSTRQADLRSRASHGEGNRLVA